MSRWAILALIALAVLGVIARHQLGWDRPACRGPWNAEGCR